MEDKGAAASDVEVTGERGRESQPAIGQESEVRRERTSTVLPTTTSSTTTEQRQQENKRWCSLLSSKQ